MNKRKARVIAYYLPQYHPIPENDEWWGKGFTEWRNVGLAKPLFKGHYQPKVPADLGYYDLRLPEVREQQAELAREAGIEGFCYWHYWFNGKELLERPFKEVLESGKPDFPFCLGWANHSWTSKTWTLGKQRKDTMLMEQTYPGIEDYTNHFYSYLKAFKDQRYITVDGKPLFVVYEPLAIPDIMEFINCWQSLAVKNGLKGFHFVDYNVKDTTSTYNILKLKSNIAGKLYTDLLNRGFDGVNSRGMTRAEFLADGFVKYYFNKFVRKKFGIDTLMKIDYQDINKHMFVEEDKWENVYPTIVPNWDRTPRNKKTVIIWYNTTPENFRVQLKDALAIVQGKKDEHKLIFLQSWNEWGEGNYIEPDCKYGHGYLNVLKDELL